MGRKTLKQGKNPESGSTVQTREHPADAMHLLRPAQPSDQRVQQQMTTRPSRPITGRVS